MFKLFLLLTLCLPFKLLGQDRNDSLQKSKMAHLEAQINKLAESNNEISELKNKLDYQERLNEKTLNSISNQISAASLNLTLFGILFSIVAVGLGVYITVVERKIVRISEENKALLVQNQLIKKDVVELNSLIQSDIRGLYQKLKREETVNMLDRLVLVPYDIVNLSSMLVSRELNNEDYDKLSKAYHQLDREIDRGDYTDFYIVIFFQFFIHSALKDKLIRQDVLEFLPKAIANCYPNDILISTKDFTNAVIDFGLENSQLLITRFFEGLTDSKFKDYSEVYRILFNTLATRSNQFELFDLTRPSYETRVARKNFGVLLLNEYADKMPTAIEQRALDRVRQLITEVDAEEQDNTDP